MELLEGYSMDEYLDFCWRYGCWFEDELLYRIRSTYGLIESLKRKGMFDEYPEDELRWLGNIFRAKRMLWRIRHGLDPY